MATLIYKIVAQHEWDAALAANVYAGSADDERDGFIHFSRAHQLEATALKYFAGRADLVLVAVNAEQLGPALRHEPSRGGDLFPHLYGSLPVHAVIWWEPLRWQAGAFVWPTKLEAAR